MYIHDARNRAMSLSLVFFSLLRSRRQITSKCRVDILFFFNIRWRLVEFYCARARKEGGGGGKVSAVKKCGSMGSFKLLFSMARIMMGFFNHRD